MPRPDTIVLLAAGQGTRMRSARAKVLAPLCGRPMVAWALERALELEPGRVLVVVGHGAEEVRALVEGFDPKGRVRAVLQEPQRGTGHAVQCCAAELGEDPGLVVVLYGDMPLLSRESLERLCAAQGETRGGAAMLTAQPRETRGFGRVLRRPDGGVAAIVEERDAGEEVRAIREVNLGVYAFPGRDLVRLLPRLESDNAQGELYLTDVVAMLVEEGRRVEAVQVEDEREAIGVNTVAHLAQARRALQMAILEEHMENGVYVEDPATTYVDHGVSIGAGTRILPCTVIKSGARIGADCEVGPFAHLRAGAVLEDGAELGNFVEAKNARLGEHSKAKHLSYLGDVEIGPRSNIGAGTIFANYDGRAKHRCTVGERSFVGSGTILVAPAEVGDRATTGAGAVLKRGTVVPPGETWVGVPARPIRRRGGAQPEAPGEAGAGGGTVPAERS